MITQMLINYSASIVLIGSYVNNSTASYIYSRSMFYVVTRYTGCGEENKNQTKQRSKSIHTDNFGCEPFQI